MLVASSFRVDVSSTPLALSKEDALLACPVAEFVAACVETVDAKEITIVSEVVVP